MRHRIYGRQFGRTKNERTRLFRSLVSELILHGRIETTIAKAKAVKPLIDKLVTKAKKKNLAAQRDLLGVLPKEAAVFLMDSVVPAFAPRVSGFSRIIHTTPRKGDNAEMVLLEWVEVITPVVKTPKVKVAKKVKTEPKAKEVKKPAEKKVTK